MNESILEFVSAICHQILKAFVGTALRMRCSLAAALGTNPNCRFDRQPTRDVVASWAKAYIYAI